MSLTPSMMPPLGTAAPDFLLPDTEGRSVSARDFAAAPALLTVFMSLHCPYTLHILPQLLEISREFRTKHVAVIAINSNDPALNPEDDPAQMARAAKVMEFPFPFLVDTTQDVAKSFQAACTPDFFLYDKSRNLVYRGRFDDSRPDNDTPVTGDQLRAAMEAVLAGRPVSKNQKPSVGCNIKWKPGNEPAYFLAKQSA